MIRRLPPFPPTGSVLARTPAASVSLPISCVSVAPWGIAAEPGCSRAPGGGNGQTLLNSRALLSYIAGCLSISRVLLEWESFHRQRGLALEFHPTADYFI